MKQPTRWAAGELPEDLASVLASADADAPELSIDRVRARLDAALGSAFTAEAPAAHSGGAQLMARGKWLGLGAIVAVGVGMLLLTRPAAEARQTRPQPSAATIVAYDAGVQEPELPPSAPAPDDLQPSAAGKAAPPVHVRRAAPAGLAEELRQLKQIREHVASAPARALTEADAHARHFPRGTLGPERELLRIDALVHLGRIAEARKLAEHQLAAPGGTPYRARIEKLLRDD